MSRVPFTTRVAVGAVVTVIVDAQRRCEELRRQVEADLERRFDEFLDRMEEPRRRYTLAATAPMTAVSEMVQRGIRFQQALTGLAIKGDEALAPFLNPPEEQPAWATFDDDDDLDDEE